MKQRVKINQVEDPPKKLGLDDDGSACVVGPDYDGFKPSEPTYARQNLFPACGTLPRDLNTEKTFGLRTKQKT